MSRACAGAIGGVRSGGVRGADPCPCGSDNTFTDLLHRTVLTICLEIGRAHV